MTVEGEEFPDRKPGPSFAEQRAELARRAADPTPLMAAALATREVFVAYVAAGFSEHQACVILGTWLATTGQGGTGDVE